MSDDLIKHLMAFYDRCTEKFGNLGVSRERFERFAETASKDADRVEMELIEQ